jgi:hypothetical protein
MKNLIPMIDFVLEQSEIGFEIQILSHQNKNRADRFSKLVKYANFLKQPLKLEMFIPCDEDGNILEEPMNYKYWVKKSIGIPYILDLRQYEIYQKAKEKVLFEGFVATITNNEIFIKSDKNNLIFDIENNQFYYKKTHYWQPVKLIEDLIPYNLEIKNEIFLF